MSMTVATPTLSIDVLHDLESGSALTDLLKQGHTALFQIAGEALKFPLVRDAAAAKVSAELILAAPASWTLPNGIGLSLAGQTGYKLSIDTVSETFSVATKLDSDTTTDVVAGPRAGVAYINIDLDFSIQGSASVSGSFNGLGVAATASGGLSSTLTFCQPVDDSLSTIDAVKLALSQIIFPLDPTRIRDAQTGSLTRVIFDGAFNAEVDVSFGLGDHTFAAPGVATALASAAKVVSITPPSIEINAGATGSVTFSHSDHFALVLDKSTDTVATVYLLRALQTDAGITAGFTANIVTTNVSVAIDPTALTDVVKHITRSGALAQAVVEQASAPLNNLITSLNAKLANLAAKVSGQITATVGLARHHDRTALFVFEADLTSPDLTEKSWTALVGGNITDALRAGGLTLQPGSGISENLMRSATFHFQFFNLFQFDSVSDFFSNATAELGPDGTIRLFATIGQESSSATKKAFSSFRIYFVVGATSDSAGNVSQTDVDLRIELSEASRTSKGASFADTLALAPIGDTGVTAARKAMATYLVRHPQGKVSLIYDIKPTAYRNLAFSAYTGKKPGALPQANDQANWGAFHAATILLARDLSFVPALTYSLWADYNRASIDQPGSAVVPDRRQVGSSAAGLTVLANQTTRPLAGFFLQASQGFMNLCEDLSVLAAATTAATDMDNYNSLLQFLTQITTEDVYIDYAIPTAGALLKQCSFGGAAINSTTDQPLDGSAITCTLTLA